jgi:hypothetical protein
MLFLDRSTRPRTIVRRHPRVVALGVYALGSIALFGFPVLLHPGSVFVGAGKNDAKLYTWCLAWWPHAILSGTNPFIARVLFVPVGANLAWVTSLPGPSLALAGVTLAFGPIVSSNILALAAPALAAWGAYLLCEHLTRRFWPSLAGGFVYGFSTYEMSQMRGHLNLVLVFPVPFAVLLGVMLLDGTVERGRFLLLFTTCLVGLFSISTELFATATLFGGIALVLGLLFGSDAGRQRIRNAIGAVAASYAIAAIVLSPYLYYVFARGIPPNTHSPLTAACDLLSFVVPRSNTLVGGHEMLPVTRHFTDSVTGDSGYLGIPLIGIVIAYGWKHRHEPVARLLLAMFGLTAIFAMGTTLHLDGRPLLPLPWTIVAKLPLIGKAIPDRLGMYTSLVAGVFVALWLAERPDVLRGGAVVVAGAMLLPNVWLPIWHGPVSVPAFISQGLYRRYLSPGESVVTIPHDTGVGMLWQTDANYSFRLAGGYVGTKPARYRYNPAVQLLSSADPAPREWRLLSLFLERQHVGAIIVLASEENAWRATLTELGARPVAVGGIVLYRSPWRPALPTRRQAPALRAPGRGSQRRHPRG